MAQLGLLSRRLPRRRLPGRFASEDGMAIVLSMSVAFVVFTLGAVWIGIGTHQVTITGRDKLRDQARHAAEAGINAAMSGLSANAGFTGFGVTSITGGQFEVTVLPVSVDPDDPRRYIVARGYAPTKLHPRRVARRLEQQVEVIPTDGFRYALFTSPGGVTGANRMTVNGDIYANGNLLLSSNATVSGSVTALGSITTSNNSTFAGDLHAATDVTLNNSFTTVMGNVYAGGNVTMTGQVKGNVQAGGTILGGTVDGSRAQNSPPAPPLPLTLPTFTWDPANYGAVWYWASPSAFQTYWSANRSGFSGAHRVSCPAPCTTAINLGLKWTVTGDTTIVADGPVALSSDILNATGSDVSLTIVSTASDVGTTPTVTMSNNVTLPDDVKVIFYVPNGTVAFRNLKHFTGAVYASSILLDQQFTLTFKPVTLPGFDFGLTSSSHFFIQAGVFKEVPFA
jgi:cytoskeletal protein CcmA (bactofilin family)